MNTKRVRPTALRAVVISVLAAIALTGCATRSYVVLIPSPDGSVGEVTVKGEKGEQVLNRAGQSAGTDGSAMERPVAEDTLQKDFGGAMAARPKVPAHFMLYFKAETKLTSDSVAEIPKIIAEAETRPSVDVSVIGHADTVFTSEYNDELSLKRAQLVADLLRAKGLKAHSLVVESHGKRNLLIQTPDNTYEPRNRRVEVSVR